MLDGPARERASRRRDQRDGAPLRVPRRRRRGGCLGRADASELATPLRRHREAVIDGSIALGTVKLFRDRRRRCRSSTSLAEARRASPLAGRPRARCTTSRSAAAWPTASHEARRAVDRGGACPLRGARARPLAPGAPVGPRVRLELELGAWTEATSTARADRRRDPRLARAAAAGAPRPRARPRPTRRPGHRPRSSPRRRAIVDRATDPSWHAALACARAEVAWLERRPHDVRRGDRRGLRARSGSSPGRRGAGELAYWRRRSTESPRTPPAASRALVAPARGRVAGCRRRLARPRAPVRGSAGALRGGRRGGAARIARRGSSASGPARSRAVVARAAAGTRRARRPARATCRRPRRTPGSSRAGNWTCSRS